MSQYGRLARMSKGVTAKHMTEFYLAVAVPRMLYAADLFLVPGTSQSKGTKGHINKLARIQRQAALAITGAMKTTATDTLDAHANLLPFPLLVSKIIHRAATRLACLPSSHPVAPHVKKAATRYVKRHRSPLHEIMHLFKLQPHKMETINTVLEGPKWTPNFKIHIPKSKDVAIVEEAVDNSDIKVYSDGSCFEGGIGRQQCYTKTERKRKW